MAVWKRSIDLDSSRSSCRRTNIGTRTTSHMTTSTIAMRIVELTAPLPSHQSQGDHTLTTGSPGPEEARGVSGRAVRTDRPRSAQRLVQPTDQAAGRVLDRQRVRQVVPPRAVDVEVADQVALLAEAQLLHHPAAGPVLGADVDLDAVQADRAEAVVGDERDGGRDDAAPGVSPVDPVANLP